VKKLWQLKTFPFDPNRRCSSALVLTLHHDNQFRLWVLIKGAADSLLTRINSHISAESFHSWYENTTRNIERLGMRVIALGVKDVSSDTRFLSHLFPEGLHMLRDDQRLIFKLKEARKWTNDHMERIVVEDESQTTINSFDFVGFCCFEAALRRSSGRVVTALNRSGVRSIICTGDSVEAASAVAKSVGILSQKYTAVLEAHQHELVWKLSNLHQSMASHHLIPFQKLSLAKLWANRGQYSVCLTGDALSLLSDIHNDRISTDGVTRNMCSDFLQKLNHVTILARASPSKKQLFVSYLKGIGCKVVMCGDGVNDVAALRESDLSVALLNGYSDISTLQGDVEDEPALQGDAEDDRRRDRWRRIRMGANSSPAQIRFLHNLEAIQNSSERSQPKDIVSAYLYALRKELDRIKRLRDGGAKAAQVLAEDDRLLRHLSGANIEGSKTDATGLIKSGEACLAAKFTCLRPCIDGVEYIIRHGIAASAFSLTLRRVVFLNSLMACFNLATLYRNGFRYGRYMWNVELFLAMVSKKFFFQPSM
jgi:cation-transporting ATPase 13A1